MGIKIFRDDNWNRIRCGDISRRDIMGLDPDLDRELIGYLLLHAQRERAASMRNYLKENCGMHELPKSLVNTLILYSRSIEPNGVSISVRMMTTGR